MSAAIVTRTRTLTPELVTVASMLVRLAHPDDKSLYRALEKAQERLLTLPWTVELGILIITSHSHPSDVHLTDGDTCDCLTQRGICWHRAAWHILSAVFATGASVIAALPLPAGFHQLADDELPGDFLDSLADEDTFGGTAEGWDSYGDVVPAPAPFRLQPAREIVPAPGSAFERSQALADRMFAA